MVLDIPQNHDSMHLRTNQGLEDRKHGMCRRTTYQAIPVIGVLRRQR